MLGRFKAVFVKSCHCEIILQLKIMDGHRKSLPVGLRGFIDVNDDESYFT